MTHFRINLQLRRRSGHIFFQAAVLVFSALILACSPKPPNLPNGTVIPLTELFHGNYSLIDTKGAPRTGQSYEGKPALIYFGFTSCPDVCPAALNIMSASLNEMGTKADHIQPIFIGLDTTRDTPKAIGNYLSFDSRILGLSGDEEQIEQAKSGFRVFSERVELPDSALKYSINHSSFFYYVNGAGTPLYAIKDTLSPQLLAKFLTYEMKKEGAIR